MDNDLRNRVERLERQNHFLRACGLTVLLCGGGTLLMAPAPPPKAAETPKEHRFNFFCQGARLGSGPEAALLLEYTAYTFKTGEVFVKCAAVLPNGKKDTTIDLYPPGSVGTDTAQCALALGGDFFRLSVTEERDPVFKVTVLGKDGTELSSAPKRISDCRFGSLK